jgi:hypothetical protein
MKSQLWLKMEVNGQLHAVSTVHSGEETPALTGQKNQGGPRAILLIAMMRKIWTTVLGYEYHSCSS